jgi:transcriptional regulator with XRE-family HTH domain
MPKNYELKKQRAKINENSPTENFYRIEGVPADMYDARSFAGQMDTFLVKKNMSQEEVCKRADMDPRDLSRKRNPYKSNPNGQRNDSHRSASKDDVIKIAIGLMLNVDEANRLLDAANVANLKPIRERDNCILKYYDKIVDYFQQNPDNPDIFNPEIEELNRELRRQGLDILFGGKKYDV